MFRYGEHTADLEVFVEADSFEELVEESIRAVTEAVAEDVKEEEEKVVEVSGDDEEELLFRALEEVIFLQSTGFYVKSAEVRRNGEKLKMRLKGGRAKAKDEIKAVTWHEFWVKRKDRWEAHFICDL